MNYRHAFHAGNHADCLKHALLLCLLDALRRKPAPFFVLDTHAGPGLYDLHEGDAARTAEWHEGIARLLNDPPPPLHPYINAIQNLPLPLAGLGREADQGWGEGGLSTNPTQETKRTQGTFLYPGSPLLIRARLRPDDRLACCERHPEDARALRALFRHDPQVAVHARDGYESIRALLPPTQRRGLILIDPPYEEPGEFDRILAALRTGAARFPQAIYAAWYPIKHRTPITAFHESVRLAGLRDVVAAELWLRPPTDPARLNGSGLLLRNPPYGFEPAAAAILQSLQSRLSTDPGAGHNLLRLTDE